MKHSCPVMQKRLESLNKSDLTEHVSYYSGTETGDAAEFLLGKMIKDKFDKLDKNGDGVITKDEFDR